MVNQNFMAQKVRWAQQLIEVFVQIVVQGYLAI